MTDGRHALLEARSLALHRAVAARLLADPRVLERARARVCTWLAQGSVAPRWAAAWREALAAPPERVAALLCDDSERARALRQTSPFAGVLDPRARWAIWRAVRAPSDAA